MGFHRHSPAQLHVIPGRAESANPESVDIHQERVAVAWILPSYRAEANTFAGKGAPGTGLSLSAAICAALQALRLVVAGKRERGPQLLDHCRNSMGEIIQFVSKSELERARLIREARALYDSIFPPAGPVSEAIDGGLDKRTQVGGKAATKSESVIAGHQPGDPLSS
jgi:hypothetical protein